MTRALLIMCFAAVLGIVPASLAATPDWVRILAQHDRLGEAADEDKLLRQEIAVEFDRTAESTSRAYRLAFLVGGSGRFADFLYAVPHVTKQGLHIAGTWIIAPDRTITSFPKSGIRCSSALRDNILYSDDFITSWSASNLEIGSIVALDFMQMINYAVPLGSLLVQSELWTIDTTIIRIEAGGGDSVALIPANIPLDRWVIRENEALCGPMKKWESCGYDGGFTQAAGQIAFNIYPPESQSNPIDTWAAVGTRISEEWNRRAGSVRGLWNVNFAAENLRDSLTAIVRGFEEDFRYVAVEIGAGRFIPHSPKDVARFKYGDCKDLSFFLTNYFNENGITAFPIAVDVPFSRSFNPLLPCPYQFNHAILAVVVNQDTLYYDPTARGYSTGILPWADQGAFGLVIREGGSLIALPRDHHPIQIVCRFNGTLNTQGRCEGTMMLCFDSRLSHQPLISATGEELQKYFRRLIRPEFAAEFANLRFDADSGRLAADVALLHTTRTAGDRLYWTPYPFVSSYRDSAGCAASAGYYFPRPQHSSTQVEIVLPQGYAIDCSFSDSTKLSVGEVRTHAASSSEKFSGLWEIEHASWHYPSDSKNELDSLLRAIQKSVNLRCRLSQK